MNISFIGTGNCATVIARLSKLRGHHVRQFIGRNAAAGARLSQEFGASYIHMNDEPDRNVDLVIVSISDNALQDGLSNFNFGSVPVVHTAGAVSMHTLHNVSENIGVLYPLQSINKDMLQPPPIPFIIEANNPATLEMLRHFASTLSNKVEVMGGEKRLRLHAAAVIVNNFTNYLYSVAKEFCEKEQVDFDLLKPIILETAERIVDHSPTDVQTGPAKRGDITTLDKHLRLFSAYPKLRTLYMRMSDGIMNP